MSAPAIALGRRPAAAPLRLLHVIHGAPGGIGRVEKLLGAVWAEQVCLEVTTLRRMAYPEYFEAAGGTAIKPIGGWRWALSILAAFWLTRPQVVILNHINFAPLSLLFRLTRPRARIVVLAYGVESWTRPSWIKRLGLSRAHQVWAISAYTARELAASCRLREDRLVVLPLALLPERAEALGGTAGSSQAEGFVLTVSRLWSKEEKGIDHLIQAVAAAGTGVRLQVVGDGDDRPRLERVAAEAGVRSRVTFLGHLDDRALVDAYRRCQLFALPSLREGFGLVFLEAMAAGKPVLAARAGATPELVRDGSTGVLVPPGDPRALTAALQSLLQDQRWAAALGRCGKQVAEQEFSFTAFANRVSLLLAALTGQPALAAERRHG